ncbi:MAG: PepSY-associated TM helix domain-containing protein [Pseudomonadota bacterium]
MSFLSQAKTKRFLSVHGWSGTILGLLLYVCIFTGSIVVFDNEIGTWSKGQINESRTTLGPRIDHHFRTAARDVDRSYYEEVSIFRTSEGDMRYIFHTHDTDPETGQIIEPKVDITLDPETGEVIERWEGLSSEQPRDAGSALANFWVDLHVQLYLPNPYGLILVGVLGMMMMAAAISGIIIHSHVFRDAFVAGRGSDRLVGARDLHVLAGTWGLPFAFILAFTGAFFGFATSVGIPVVAMSAFGGDQQALIETVIGTPEELDLTPAPMASLDYVIMDATRRTGSEVSSIDIRNYDSASAEILVRAGAAEGSLISSPLAFDGVTRSFKGERPFIGQAPSLGSSLIGIMPPLHFGNFAGLASKMVWLGMGLAMAYVTATGMLLWTKRRQDVPLWQGFRRWIVVTVWGLPLAMLVSAVVFFLVMPAGDPHWWTPVGFLFGALFAIAVGLRRSDAPEVLRLTNALLCLSLPVLRHLTGGTSWSEAIIAGGEEILVIDLLLLVFGLLLLRKSRQTKDERTTRLVQEPAE